jgi:NAD dependent epimerase/dehydratase
MILKKYLIKVRLVLTKKIFITGATGFIGSHLAELCIEEGFNVIAFDRYNINNDWGWLEHSKLKNDMEIILGDIRDYDSVFRSMKGCDVVFHLAALIGIPYSYVSPLAYIRTNIEGTYNVLESARNLDLEQILITSTSETYGTAQYVPIDEFHPLVGQSPYSASKIAADQMGISYYKSFDLPLKIVRPFNTYGPRQSARAIIPAIISQCISKTNEIKLGSLNPTRDLTYVKDTCAGFIEIYKSEKLFGEITNIGMNSEISMGDLVDKIIENFNMDFTIVDDVKRVRPKSSEVERLVCNNNKLLEDTAWKPKYNLESGLKETIKWFHENSHLFKNDIYNV